MHPASLSRQVTQIPLSRGSRIALLALHTPPKQETGFSRCGSSRRGGTAVTAIRQPLCRSRRSTASLKDRVLASLLYIAKPLKRD